MAVFGVFEFFRFRRIANDRFCPGEYNLFVCGFRKYRNFVRWRLRYCGCCHQIRIVQFKL